MFAGTYKRHENHLIDYKGQSVLRTATIYGTNGSGKTNLLLALQYLHKLIVRGTRDISEKLNVPTFKLSNCKNLPTKFEIDFLSENKRYNYKIELLDNIIIKEELYQIINNTEIIIFKRKFDGKKTNLTIAPNRDKNTKEKLREEIYAEELRENQLFLKECQNKKIIDAYPAFNWFKDKLKFISVDYLISTSNPDTNYQTRGLASTFLSDEDFFRSSKEIIKQAKVGIVDINLVEFSLDDLKTKGIVIPQFLESELINKLEVGLDIIHEGELYSSYKKNNDIRFVKISTIHENSLGQEIEFKFSEESKGVQRLFELLPALYKSIHDGEVFIVDEIEYSFHPVLLKEIISLYLNTKPDNSGQLIFSTHESHLLDLALFRQDEIWFCEKDKDGSTKLYSLSEFKPRFDKDIRKGYLEGQFSFIPFLGDAAKLLEL
jgi:hypothetical protein